MEGLATDAGKILLSQGVLGLAVLALAIALIYVYREKRLTDKARIDELARLIEGREGIQKAFNANTLALEANNKASEARTRATEEIAREVAGMRQRLELDSQQVRFDMEAMDTKIEDIKRTLERRAQ